MKPFEISFLILKSISLSRTFAFCRERLLMISWVTPIWARICLPQTWRNRERETSTRSRVRSGGKQRGLTPFHDDKIRSHITHDMVTTFQFTYLHLLEATTDKKEVRLQFYLNSNGTRYSFENLVLHLLAFFKILSLCSSLSWTSTILFIADLKNGIRTGQMIVFLAKGRQKLL